MSALKQGQTGQVLFTIYSTTTGKQYSGCTASMLVVNAPTMYGIKFGGSTAAVAKVLGIAPSLIRSRTLELRSNACPYRRQQLRDNPAL